MYMIHERKLNSAHDLFFQHVRTACPEIQLAKNTLMVTDGETAIRQAIHDNLTTRTFLCWNHITQVLQNNMLYSNYACQLITVNLNAAISTYYINPYSFSLALKN